MSTFTAEEITKLQAGGNEVRRMCSLPLGTSVSQGPWADPRATAHVMPLAQVARTQYQSGYSQPLPDAECVAPAVAASLASA